MFDSEYFRTILDADVEATDPDAAVEVHLTNGHTLRVGSVLSVHGEYVTLEVYRAPRGEGGQAARWHGSPALRPVGTSSAEPQSEQSAAPATEHADGSAGTSEPETAGKDANATPPTSSTEMLRAVVSYAAIVAVTIVPRRAETGGRVGFGS